MLLAGLQPNFWRGITDNDVANGTQERCATWREAGKKMVLKSIKTQADNQKATVTADFDMPEQESQVQITYHRTAVTPPRRAWRAKGICHRTYPDR